MTAQPAAPTVIPLKTDAPAPTPATAGDMERRNRNVLKAIVIGPVMKENITTGETKALPPDDLITAMQADGRILVPPFDKLILAQLPENCTEMGQCVEAMEINVDGFGHRLELRAEAMDETQNIPAGIKAAVMKERAMLLNFLKYCCPGYSFTDLRRRTRKDMETTGEGFWEVLRTTAGKIVGFAHIPSYQIALAQADQTLTPYKRTLSLLNDDGVTRSIKEETAKRYFRRYVQTHQSLFSRGISWTRGNSQARWFKEYGDPRLIDKTTGMEVTEEDRKKPDFNEQAIAASELIHWKIHSPRTPYGLPRFIGNLITIFGDRAADEINYVTLRNNNIPSMAILVSNGQLTKGSIERIEEFVTNQIQGSDNYSRFLIIEGEGQYEGPESGSAMKIDIKPLTDQQMRDQMFQQYGKNNQDKIRMCWRLPPIFIGRSDDYTRATAEASRRLADEQVFSPERDAFDNWMNDILLPEMGVMYHDFWSNGPNVTDDEDMIRIMSTAESSGAMTPRVARRILADILGVDERSLPPLDPSVKPDVPFTLQVAEAVKNTAEPQHQLAVKAASALGFGDILSELLSVKEELQRAIKGRAKRTE